MNKRVAAHFLLVSADRVVRLGGVGADADGRISEVFSLVDAQYEPANTTFVDGWIAPFLIDVAGLKSDGLPEALLLFARQNGVAITVGNAATLFNYTVQEDGSVSATSLLPYFV